MTKQIPRDFIELLLAKIDLVDMINQRIPLRKKSGSNYFARCPFHQEKSASFSVSQPKQFFYCFGCGARGNAIDFMIQHDHMNFPEAIEALARSVGMEVPHTGNGPAVKKDDSLPALYDLMKEVTAYYYEQMRHSDRTIDYLKNRGISGAIAQQFSIGYAPPGWSHVLDAFGKTEADKKKLLDTGLIIKKNEGGYYDRFRDRVMFPIHDYRGRLIGFGGRVIDQGEPKYLNSPETPLFQKGHELYGLYQALKTNRQLERVMLVEGYMDVIALFQQGITYAVATLGTATTPHHLQRLFRYTSEIIFCFDGDEAGKTAAWRALQVILPLMHDSLQVRFLFLPDGEDPDSQVRKEGKEVFEKRIQTALSLSDFFFQTIGKQCDMNTMEGRARFASSALTHIKQLPPGIYQGILLTELSKRARVDLDDLKKQLTINGDIKVTTPTPERPVIEENMNFSAPMRILIALLIQHPHLAEFVEEDIPQASISGAGFFNLMVKIIREGAHTSTATVVEYWRGQKEESFINRLAMHEHMIPEDGVKQEFLGMLKHITSYHLQSEIDNLLAKAAQQDLSEADKKTLTELISKKKTVSR